MSERERWIVYPLLFLALGAALRDKIIKTTDNQRIKCQGLAVFDSNDQPVLVLGPEQFPEMFRPNAPSLLQIDEVKSKRVVADVVAGKSVVGDQFATNKDRIGRLVANEIVAGNYVLSDGKNSFRIDGRYTVPLFHLLKTLQQSVGTPPAAAKPQNEATAVEGAPEREAEAAADDASIESGATPKSDSPPNSEVEQPDEQNGTDSQVEPSRD